MAFIDNLFAPKRSASAQTSGEKVPVFKKPVLVQPVVPETENVNAPILVEKITIKTDEQSPDKPIEEVALKTEEEAKSEVTEEASVKTEAPVTTRKKRVSKKVQQAESVEPEAKADAVETELPAETKTEFVNVKYEPEKISLADLRKAFYCNINDPEWDEIKADLENRVMNIKIAEDINTGSVKLLLAQTSNLYSDLRREQRANKAFYNVLSSKVYGIMPRQKIKNSFGKNAEERNRNAENSCEKFIGKDGKEYDLYAMASVMEDRITTIDSLIDDVRQKRETLISYIAVLKIESGMK